MGFNLKKAFTPPKSKNNIIKAAAAPFTLGLSLGAPNSAVEAAKSAVRYTGAATQSIVAPVLPKNVQAKVFGLNKAESRGFDILQWVSRGVFAIAGGAKVLGVIGAGKAAAGAASKAPSVTAPGGAFDYREPANLVAASNKSPIFGTGPANYVALGDTAASSRAGMAAVKAGEAAVAAGKKGGAATFLSKLQDKAGDVLTTGLLVAGVKMTQPGVDGGSGGPSSSVSPGGGGGGIMPIPQLFNGPAGGGEAGEGRAQMMVMAVVLVALAGAAYFVLRKRAA